MPAQSRGTGARRSPQEKKALSYARDRRNAYGENDKSSRKNIPLRQRMAARANRRAEGEQLRLARTSDAAVAEERETVALGRRRRRWSKNPDIPLREHLQRQTERRRQRSSSSSGPTD